jgi:hypothetical protein
MLNSNIPKLGYGLDGFLEFANIHKDIAENNSNDK